MIYLAWGALSAITICLCVYFHSNAENRVVYRQTHNLQPGTKVVFSDPIELKSRQNLEVAVYAPLDNSWAWVGGNFIDEESGMVEEFELPVEYYSGREGSEKWTEGSERNRSYITSLPAGRYTLRLEFQWEHFASPQPITVTVTWRRAHAAPCPGAARHLCHPGIRVYATDGVARHEPAIQPTSLMLNKFYLILGFAIVLFYALTAFFGYEYGSSQKRRLPDEAR